MTTDAKPVAGQVKVVRLPGWAQPKVKYEMAVVKASSNRAAAQAFVSRVLAKKGRALLAASYDRVMEAADELTAGLSPCERADVFGATAVRSYRLHVR